MANTYSLTVIYLAKDGCGRAFVKEMEESGVATKVRREDGCLHYDYYFKSWDEDTVLLFEEWESKEHQQVHIKQPHIKDLKAIKEKYIIHSEKYDNL